MRYNFLTSVLFILLIPLVHFAQLPAFPGAEGFGAMTAGGRGGALIEVINLNDAGPGSFREACNTPGARTIVFRTGGIIELQSEIQLMEPYVTIAGQTAPGDGIVLKNFPFTTFTHDVIIRGLRIRAGDENPHAGADNRDCITIEHGSHHIIIDHCSMSWGIDENVSLTDSSNHVTLQWNIISEGLYKSIHPKGPHSMGLLIGFGSHQTSVHHNLFAHNNGRNPVILGGTNHEFINNLIYDWGYSSEFLENGSLLEADITGNYWKPLSSIVDTSEFPINVDFDSSTAFGSRLYCKSNLYVGIPFLTPTQIQKLGGNAIIISDSSLLDSASTVSFNSPDAAYDTVLALSGALHPHRDVVDTRIIKDVRDSTGGLVDCIYSNLILLDSGKVISGTDTTIIYSQANTFPAISAEGRKIQIISGMGAGQSRHGIDVLVIDSANRIVAALIDTPWTIIPDSTSIYEIIATCDHYIGGWPVYSNGVPPADNDHDGMPDIWETAHLLNPLDSSDRNGTNLDSTGYTNLEVYLNEFYKPNHTISVQDIPCKDIFNFKSYPNPFSEKITITFTLHQRIESGIIVYDLYGNVVKRLLASSLDAGEYHLSWDGTDNEGNTLAGGVYFIGLETPSFKRFAKAVYIR